MPSVSTFREVKSSWDLLRESESVPFSIAAAGASDPSLKPTLISSTFQSTGLGKHRPLVIDGTTSEDLFKIFRVLPTEITNLQGVHKTENDLLARICLLARVSRVAKITWRVGLENLERILTDVYAPTNTKSAEFCTGPLLDLNEFRHAKLSVKISVEQTPLLEGMDRELPTSTYVGFSFGVVASLPLNRFAQKFTAFHFCKVSFSLPNVQLQDIVDHHMRTEPGADAAPTGQTEAATSDSGGGGGGAWLDVNKTVMQELRRNFAAPAAAQSPRKRAAMATLGASSMKREKIDVKPPVDTMNIDGDDKHVIAEESAAPQHPHDKGQMVEPNTASSSVSAGAACAHSEPDLTPLQLESERVREGTILAIHQALSSIAHSQISLEKDRDSLGPVRRRIMEYFLTLSEAEAEADSHVSVDSQKSERESLDSLARDSVDLVGAAIEFAGQTWSLISTNISGALNSSYVYTCEDPLSVMQWGLCIGYLDQGYLGWPLKSKHGDSVEKLMGPILRMGLFNTTCIKVLDSAQLAAGGSITMRVYKDLAPDGAPDGRFSVHDGCGRVSLSVAKQMLVGYRDNWFTAKRLPPACAHHAARKLLNDGFNSCDFAECVVENGEEMWPSPDLPPPKGLPEGYVPAAFQIRVRGCKGMVVVDCDLPGNNIVLYDSMVKFKTQPDNVLDALQLAGLSRPSPVATLSSELIIMFELTVKPGHESTLRALLKQWLTSTEDGDIKIPNFITSALQSDSPKRVLADVVPYLANLAVPMPESAYVFGVADFTQTLAPDQVFFQPYRVDDDGRAMGPLLGPVLLAKSPMLMKDHLVRFNAVRIEALMHLYDVVVFSTQGNKMPSETVAGADLDGDHFILMWNRALIDTLECNDCGKMEIHTMTPLDSVPGGATQIVVHHGASPCLPSWRDKASQFRGQALDTMRKPFNNFRFCNITHLLKLRRRLLDAGDQIPLKVNTIVGSLIDRTFIAPKHGNWVEWTTLFSQCRKDLAKLPRLPAYVQQGGHESHSLYAHLYRHMMTATLGAEATHSDPTLCLGAALDHVECLTRATARFDDFQIIRGTEIEKLAEKLLKQPSLFDTTTLRAIAAQLITSSRLDGEARDDLDALQWAKEVGLAFPTIKNLRVDLDTQRQSYTTSLNSNTGCAFAAFGVCTDVTEACQSILLRDEYYTTDWPPRFRWPKALQFLIDLAGSTTSTHRKHMSTTLISKTDAFFFDGQHAPAATFAYHVNHERPKIGGELFRVYNSLINQLDRFRTRISGARREPRPAIPVPVPQRLDLEGSSPVPDFTRKPAMRFDERSLDHIWCDFFGVVDGDLLEIRCQSGRSWFACSESVALTAFWLADSNGMVFFSDNKDPARVHVYLQQLMAVMEPSLEGEVRFSVENVTDHPTNLSAFWDEWFQPPSPAVSPASDTRGAEARSVIVAVFRFKKDTRPCAFAYLDFLNGSLE
eukprot:m.423822 g.423822  ORF g.423822 m.423822 type:complete len:1447 (+) comp43460_c0_seq1:130-4470(+)